MDTRMWIRQRANNPVRVVLGLGPAGSGPTWWSGLSDRMPAQVELRVPVLPGRWSRSREPALTKLDEVVADLSSTVGGWLNTESRPVRILGVCGGAVIALELVAALTDRQRSAVAGLDLFKLPALATATGPQLHQLSRQEFRKALAAQGILPAELADDDLFAYFEPVLRADTTMIENYQQVRAPDLRGIEVTAHVNGAGAAAVDQWRAQGVTFAAVRDPGAHADTVGADSTAFAPLLNGMVPQQ